MWTGRGEAKPSCKAGTFSNQEFASGFVLQVLRLMCIQCLTNNGFKPKLWEFYMREILQVMSHSCALLWTVKRRKLIKSQPERMASMQKDVTIAIGHVSVIVLKY